MSLYPEAIKILHKISHERVYIIKIIKVIKFNMRDKKREYKTETLFYSVFKIQEEVTN